MDKNKRKEILLLTSIAIGYKYGPYELDLDDKYYETGEDEDDSQLQKALEYLTK